MQASDETYSEWELRRRSLRLWRRCQGVSAAGNCHQRPLHRLPRGLVGLHHEQGLIAFGGEYNGVGNGHDRRRIEQDAVVFLAPSRERYCIV